METTEIKDLLTEDELEELEIAKLEIAKKKDDRQIATTEQIYS